VSNPHVQFELRPDLDRPAMVAAIRGWNDGGEAASIAARYLIERWDGAVIATLDPEEFVDFQVTRPTVHLEDGVSRVIEWPRGEFTLAAPEGRDVVFFTAVEPNMRWRTFSSAIIETAQEIGTETLVTLGAFLTNVPHSRPVPVVGSAPTPEEAGGLGLATSQYEGPTGIVGVLHDSANKAGLRSISLWAAVPHYLPVAPNPKAALALVQRLTAILHTEVELASLQQAAREWEDSVGRLLEENSELGAYVEQLEQAVDSGDTEIRITEDIPSGDAIAAELERFLRENETGDETD
jgi:predicted ATP-grasp superfamily ATP-dependent carboligase